MASDGLWASPAPRLPAPGAAPAATSPDPLPAPVPEAPVFAEERVAPMPGVLPQAAADSQLPRARRRESVAAKETSWAEERERQMLLMQLNRKVAELGQHFHRLRQAYASAQRDLELEVQRMEEEVAEEKKTKTLLQRDYMRAQDQLETIEKAVRRRASAEQRWKQLERDIQRDLNVTRAGEEKSRQRIELGERQDRAAMLKADVEGYGDCGGCERREAVLRARVGAEEGEAFLLFVHFNRGLAAQRELVSADEAQIRRGVAAEEQQLVQAIHAACLRDSVAAQDGALLRERNYSWMKDPGRWRWSPGREVLCPSSVDADPRFEVLCCFPCQAAEQQLAAEGREDDEVSWGLLCMSLALTLVPYVGPGVMVLRTRLTMRRNLSIYEGSAASDVGLSLFCWPVVLCQHWQELRHRGHRPRAKLFAHGDELPPDAIPAGMLPPTPRVREPPARYSTASVGSGEADSAAVAPGPSRSATPGHDPDAPTVTPGAAVMS
eukprot:TRINITY_DN30434_c0_g1_i1.p2 TRINITY_DN30434_c0_g1~~TRINITY_DN30434_c0_g1_i1.p2  ORF type:complete len:512 (+),score=163.61 TRINITY_DN30434_c0_g1_i1:56-1537(+)